MLTGRDRSGVSLIELVVVLAILGVAAGALSRIATSHQRQYARLAARGLAMAQLREGLDVLSSELAGISSRAGDIYDGGMGTSSIEFRLPVATAVLCEAPRLGVSEIEVMLLASIADSATDDRDPAAGAIAPGDSLWLHHSKTDTTGAPEGSAWRGFFVEDASQIRRPCGGLNEGQPGAAGRLTLGRPLDSRVEQHAPIRVFRRARYALYRAADAHWYLGFSDCRPLVRTPVCSPLQPVAGPYFPPAGSSASVRGGLRFVYLDASGKATTNPRAVAAIAMELRANAAAPGWSPDTVVAARTVGLRNSLR